MFSNLLLFFKERPRQTNVYLSFYYYLRAMNKQLYQISQLWKHLFSRGLSNSPAQNHLRKQVPILFAFMWAIILLSLYSAHFFYETYLFTLQKFFIFLTFFTAVVFYINYRICNVIWLILIFISFCDLNLPLSSIFTTRLKSSSPFLKSAF